MEPKWFAVLFDFHDILIDTGGVYMSGSWFAKGRIAIAIGMAFVTICISPIYSPRVMKTAVAVQHMAPKSNAATLHTVRLTSSRTAPKQKAMMLVVCASFLGKPATKPLSLYQNLYFGNHHSVASYYQQVSYGQLQITGRVVGDPLHPGKFLQLPHLESYYARTENGSGGNFPNNDDGIVADVIKQLVKDHFDFKPYVVNGEIPYFAIVFSGYGADVEPTNKNLIWPVESNLQYPIKISLAKFGERTPVPTDVAVVNAYDLVPELDDFSGDPVTLGVLAHEFGHLMGLMDLYDVSSSANAGQGIGPFSLMGTGNWNGYPAGDQPSGLDPFSLMFLNWVTPIAISESETGVPLAPLETSPVVYRLNPLNYSNEYFLLSNEEALGVDVAIPDSGVFIWRIDAFGVQPSSYDWTNDVLDDPSQNRSHHYDVAIMSASNTNDLKQPEGDVTNYQDAYPSQQNNQFTASSKPANKLWNGQFLGMNITHISVNPATKWATFDVQDVQSGSSLVIPRPKTGLTVSQGSSVPLIADYTHDGVTTDVTMKAMWTSTANVKWQGRHVTFLTPGQVNLSVTYQGLSALAYFTVIN